MNPQLTFKVGGTIELLVAEQLYEFDTVNSLLNFIRVNDINLPINKVITE